MNWSRREWVVLLVILPVFLLLIALLGRTLPDLLLPDDLTFPPNNVAELRRSGQVMQALYLLEAHAEQTSWTPDALQLAGELWREAGDLTRSVAYWEAARQTRPDDPVLVRRLAQAYIELQNWTPAADTLDHLVTIQPDDKWARLQLGLLRAPIDPQTAQVHLRAAATEPAYAAMTQPLLAIFADHADDPLISMRVALELVEQEQWQFAELAFRHAATINAPYPEALAYVGLMRDNQGKDGGVWIEQAVALEPDNPQLRYLQGLHLRRISDDVGSAEVLLLAVTLEPDNPAFYAELAEAYRRLGELPLAEYHLQLAVLFSNNDPHFQELLTLFYAEEAANLTVTGIDMLEQSAAQFEDDPDVQAGLGWAQYLQGESAAGVARIDAVLVDHPDNARALYYKAQILLAGESFDEAVPLLQRLVTRDTPFSAEAEQILNRIGY